MGGAVVYNYESLAQFVRQSPLLVGIALVRVESVSLIRWNTPDGSRPPEPALHSDWDLSGGGTFRYGIGRAYQVRLERVVWGKWVAPGDTDVYWLSGGKLGNDEVGGDRFGPLPPGAGDLGLAIISRYDRGPGVISSAVSWLFPVDASGLVTTMDPKEHVTLADLDGHLP